MGVLVRSRRLAALSAIVLGLAFLGGAATGQDPRLETPFSFSFSSDLEYRYRSQDLSVETTAQKNAIDFTRDFMDRPALADLDLRFGGEEGLRAEMGLVLERQWSLEQHFTSTNLFPTTIKNNPIAMENGFVNLGILAWKVPGMEMVLGRQVVDYSDGLKGALLPSPRLPYLDAFKFHGQIGSLGLDWLVAGIRAVQAIDKVDVSPNDLDGDGNVDTPYYYGFEDGSAWVGDGVKQGNPTSIFEILHRFSWDFPRLQVGGTGHIMAARRNNRYSLIDFFPVISWHQAILTQINVSMLLDARWEPLPGLWFATQLGLDDFNAMLVGINDNDAATIGAAVLGGGYEGRLGAGRIKAYAEAGYTHFLWGNYEGTQNPPNDVNPFLRFIYRYSLDGGSVLMPLTSPYGPGALWLEASSSWEPEGWGLSLGLDLLVLSKNSAANLIDTPYYDNLDATAAAPRILFIYASLPLAWDRGLWRLSLVPELVARNGVVGFQLSVGAGLRLGAKGSSL